MLRYLRENTGNWIIKIFLGIIVIVFVFLGVGSMNANKNNEVAVVNDRPITFNEFQDAYKNAVARMRQQFGNNLNDDLLKALNVKQQALNSLIDQKLMTMEAEKLKIVVSDQELQDALVSLKAFQKNGVFDMELYKQVLARNSLTPETFEVLQRNAMRETKLRDLVLSGITVTEAEAMSWYLFQNTKMAIDYIKVDPTTFTDITPSKEEIEKQYADNSDLYKSQPMRKAAFLVFSPKDHVGQANVTDEQVQTYYDQNLERFTTPEKVEASHILIKLDENADEATVETARKAAEAVYDKAAKGEDFAELAKTFSQGPSAASGGFLGIFDKKSMVKPFGDAAFAMKAGDVSKPVQTQFGWHVIKLTARFEPSVKTMEEASPAIRTELEADEQQNLAYYKAGEAFDAVVDGDDFEQVALIAKKKIMDTKEFTVTGQGLGIENSAEFAKAAFELSNDEISDVKQMGNLYYLIKVVSVIEPEKLPLEEVSDIIAQTLKIQQQNDAASKAAQDLVAKALSAESITALAKANNLTSVSTGLFSRNQPIPDINNSQEIAKAAFGLDKDKMIHPEVMEAGNIFYIIGFKEKLVPEKDQIKDGLDKVKEEMAWMKQRQSFMAWMQSIKAKATIEINTEIIN